LHKKRTTAVNALPFILNMIEISKPERFIFFFTAVKINASVRNVGFYSDQNDRFSLPFIHTLYFHTWGLKKLLLSGGTSLAL